MDTKLGGELSIAMFEHIWLLEYLKIWSPNPMVFIISLLELPRIGGLKPTKTLPFRDIFLSLIYGT